MSMGVYLVTCTANGTQYVGSSKNIPYRWWKHRSDLRLKRHDNDRWQKTWDKYGKDAFEWSILEIVESVEQLAEREQHWIDILHPELNVYPFSEYTTMSPEALAEHGAKISKAQARRWASYDKAQREKRRKALSDGWANSEKRAALRKEWEEAKQQKALEQQRQKEERAAQREAERERKRLEWEATSEQRKAEHYRKVAEALKGKSVPKAQREKLRAVANAQWADPEYRAKHQAAVQAKMQDPEVLKRLSESHKGKKLSKEQRRKIGESGRGKKRSEETRRRLSEARKAWWARKKGEQ